MKRTTGLLLCICLLATTPAAAKTTAYTIEFAGMKVGNLYTNVQTVKGVTIYQLSSLVDFWAVVRVKIAYSITVKYEAGQMTESKVNSIANGKSYYSNITWNGAEYDLDCHTYKYDHTGKRKEPVKNSLLKLYFEEPSDGQVMLSENYGIDVPVKKLSENTYQVEVEGNKNKFFFRDGVLVMAEMQSPIKNYLVKIAE